MPITAFILGIILGFIWIGLGYCIAYFGHKDSMQSFYVLGIIIILFGCATIIQTTRIYTGAV